MSNKNYSLKKKIPLILVAVVLLAGLFVAYRYWSGNIDGAWIIEDYTFYLEEDDKWVTKEENEAESDLENHSFRVIKDGRIKDYGYLIHEEIPDVSLVTMNYYYPDVRRVNPLLGKIVHSVSDSEYERMIDDMFDTYFQGQEKPENLEEQKKGYKEDKYYSQVYRKEGDRLHITVYNTKGEKVNQLTYRKMNEEETKKELTKFHEIRKKFEKDMGIQLEN